MRYFFYDTCAFLALTNSADPNHELAAHADRSLESMGYIGATSDYVLDETLTGLHAAAGSRVALTFADSLLARVEAEYVLLVEVNALRRDKALELFRRLSPSIPRLSFTDCTSFAVMRELEVPLAFTADKHFHMAGSGIRPLLVQEPGQLVLRLPSS